LTIERQPGDICLTEFFFTQHTHSSFRSISRKRNSYLFTLNEEISNEKIISNGKKIRNMDSVTAAEWLQCLTSKLREEKEKKAHDMETLPLKSTINYE